MACAGAYQRAVTALPILAMALALSGCAALGGRPVVAPEHEIALPEGWDGAGVGAVPFDEAAYWRALGDPAITELVELALKNNLDLAQAATRLAQAREGLVQARAGFLPQVNANRSVSRSVGEGTSDEFNMSLGIDASWEADLFGRIGAGRNAAQYDLQSAGYSLVDLQRSIAGQVALQAITARATAQQLSIARDTLKIQDENLQIARWRNQAGLVSSLDVEQARSQRAQTAASIPQLESSLAATSNAISTLIGEVPGRVREVLSQPAAIPAPPALTRLAAPAELLRRRPDIRLSEANLLSDTARIGVARADLYPSLRLSGNIGTGNAGPLDLFDIITGTLTASVSQLLFDGGRTKSRIRAAEALAEGSLAAWRQSILGALEDVETAIAARRAADARLVELGVALDAASNAAIFARSQYQAGLIDFQTLLSTESQLLSARNAVISAQADRASAFIRLTQAMGGGWNIDVDPTAIPSEDTP